MPEGHAPLGSLLASLPMAAREYYVERTEKNFTDLVYKLSTLQSLWRRINTIRLYPLCNMKYLASNQCVCVIVNGEHRIYQGPG